MSVVNLTLTQNDEQSVILTAVMDGRPLRFGNEGNLKIVDASTGQTEPPLETILIGFSNQMLCEAKILLASQNPLPRQRGFRLQQSL